MLDTFQDAPHVLPDLLASILEANPDNFILKLPQLLTATIIHGSGQIDKIETNFFPDIATLGPQKLVLQDPHKPDQPPLLLEIQVQDNRLHQLIASRGHYLVPAAQQTNQALVGDQQVGQRDELIAVEFKEGG